MLQDRCVCYAWGNFVLCLRIDFERLGLHHMYVFIRGTRHVLCANDCGLLCLSCPSKDILVRAQIRIRLPFTGALINAS